MAHATVIHVYYRVSDGAICAAQYGTAGAPVDYPASNGHDAVLELPLSAIGALPMGDTHKVDTVPSPPVVVPLTQAEIDAQTDAARKKDLEHFIGRMIATRNAMAAHDPPFDTTEIDQIIADNEAAWAAL